MVHGATSAPKSSKAQIPQGQPGPPTPAQVRQKPKRENKQTMLSEVLRRDTLSQAGRARAAKAKPQTDVERLLEPRKAKAA